MPDQSSDFYQQKTNEELLFFAQHPTYYHADLVAAATRELRRRGVALLTATPAAPEEPAEHYATAGSSKRTIWLVALALLLVVGIGYYFSQNFSAEPTASQPEAAKPRRKGPPKLVDVPTAALPSYDAAVARCVNQQAKRVPAAEQTDAQALRQYRELTRRFWAAQALTEYISSPARNKQSPEIFYSQLGLVQTAWQHFNTGTRYSYKFGPVMADHFDRMRRVARQQQEALADLAAGTAPSANARATQREAEVQNLLTGLGANSPVTGQPYRAHVRSIQI